MPARDLASGAPEPPTRRPKLYLPAGGDRIIRVRIGEASHTAALDLAGADEPHEVLLDAQFDGSRPVNRLGQLQGRTARFVLDEIEQNLDLGQFRPAPGSAYPSAHRSSRCPRI